MSRTAGSFERRKAKFNPQPRTLILCEDTKSCLIYLKEAAHYFRSYAKVEIAHCGKTDPKGIVAEAAARRHKFEYVYCAIDRDSHHGFSDALALAKANDVEVIASFPCYEFWLLLHFGKTRAAYMPAGDKSAADRLVLVLKKKPDMADYVKGDAQGLFEALLPRLPTARRHSVEVLAEAISDGEMNPSTRLHILLDHLEALGQPQPIG